MNGRMEARMRVFKPNDLRAGDVLEHVNTNTVLLVVEIDIDRRHVDFVTLVPSVYLKRDRVGDRVTTAYTNKLWKRFSHDYVYLSRD